MTTNYHPCLSHNSPGIYHERLSDRLARQRELPGSLENIYRPYFDPKAWELASTHVTLSEKADPKIVDNLVLLLKKHGYDEVTILAVLHQLKTEPELATAVNQAVLTILSSISPADLEKHLNLFYELILALISAHSIRIDNSHSMGFHVQILISLCLLETALDWPHLALSSSHEIKARLQEIFKQLIRKMNQPPLLLLDRAHLPTDLSRQPDLRDAMAALDQYHCQSPEQRELWTAWLRCLHQRQLLSYALQCIPHQVGISPVFSAWIISHPSVSLLHLFDYIERMISKLPEYEEIPIQTKDPHYLKTIVSHLSHGLKTQNADLIAWSFLRVGSMGDTAAICQLMNYVDFNQPVFQEPIVQEAISFCAAQMGNRERLKELVEHFGLQTPQTLRAFYCEMNLKAVFQIERTLIRGVHGGKRPFQFYEGSNARFTYRPAFYAWDQPGSASSLAQYSGEEGGFVVWRGSGDTRSYGEGVAEEDLFDVNRLLCFILPSEQHEIVRAISQLSEKEIDQIDRGDVSEETRNLLDRIERNPAIFDLMARGLKTPIDLAPTYLLIAIWRNFQSKTLVLSKRYDRMVDGGRKEIPVFPMPPNYYTQLQKTPYQEFDLFPHSPKHFPGAKTNRMSELVEPTLDHWSILEVLNELSQPSWHLDWEKLTKQVGKMSKWTEYSQALAAIAVSLPPSERERYLSLLKEKTALEPDDVEEVRKEIPADTFFSTSKLLL